MDKQFILVSVLLGFFAVGLMAQDFYDPGTVNTIQLFFAQTNWDQLLDNLVAAGLEERLVGNAIINGVAYDSVGVRYKGNSSYSAARNKNPFNIKLDYIHENQLLDGKYGTIKLSNGFNDPSLVREALGYEIARKYMPASKANYANVYVNGTLIGVYTSVQDVDSYFMGSNLHCSGKPRFKCETNPAGNPVIWGYLGTNPTAYEALYEIESDSGWDELINFTNVLNNNQNGVSTVLNVDRHLWFLAFENLLDNFDSPINIFHNFYLFGDAGNRFNPILWDLNEAFGVYNHVGPSNLTMTQLQQYNPLANLTSPTHTLISKILSNTRYKRMYIAHMRTMITENFSNGWYSTRADQLQAICGPAVQADPNFFFTYANFLSNINTTITGGGRTYPGITALMNTRATYLLSNSAFSGTVPAISALGTIPANVTPNSNVTITMTVSNATSAFIGYRQDITLPFTFVQMFNDGQHGDGASGDGVYGISIPVGYGDLQYYGYAENSSQGAFSPARAEQEFHTVEVAGTTGNILINEINYNSASSFDPGDWVEITNAGPVSVDISSWVFKDENDAHIFSIPAGTVLDSGEYLVLCENAASFVAKFPLVTNYVGSVGFGLSGSGELVRLYDSNGTLIDFLTFDDAAPWPLAADGLGATLELIDVNSDNTLGSNWSANSAIHGTPGQINSSTPLSDVEWVQPVISGNDFILSWSTVWGATSYRIYRGTSPSNLTLYATVNAPATTYSDLNAISTGTKYFYYIVAVR